MNAVKMLPLSLEGLGKILLGAIRTYLGPKIVHKRALGPGTYGI